MVWTKEDVIEMLKKQRQELTALQSRTTDLLTAVAALTPATMDAATPGKVKCPRCGVPLSGSERLAEHNYQVHDGPYPDHWIEQDKQLDELEKEMEREHNPA